MVSRRTLLGAGGALVLAGVLGAGTTGLVPVVSDLLGTSRPRDLGVRYTQADYESGLAKIPEHRVTNPEYMCITCDYESRGSVPADDTFTQEEFTAQMNVLNSRKGPLDDIQVRFNDDGTVETSSIVDHSLFTGPVYARGRVVDYSSRAVVVAAEKAEVGRVGLDESQTEDATQLMNGLLSDFFVRNPGLSVESLDVESGGVRFKGTFPEEMVGDPNVVPQDIS
jgi:hypothetical protein